MKMPKKWYDELVSLCNIQSHSNNEKFMLLYLIHWIEELNLEWHIDNIGNLITTKGEAKTYPCIVSHMDTVHKCIKGYEVWSGLVDKQKALWAQSGKATTGIGGDDKCGVFACLYFLKTLPSVKIVFFTQEESGCKGSDGIDLQFFKDCRYIIQLDRRDKSDFIDSKFNDKTVSHQFSSEIGHIKKKYKFKSAIGSITDSINLFNRDVGISCVNISSGYYRPHTNDEYIIIDDLWNSILLTQEIIKTLKPKIYQHKKKVITYNPKWNSNTYATRQCNICHKWKGIKDYQLIDTKVYCYDCLKVSANYSRCDDCNKYVETSKMVIVPKKSKDKKGIGSEWICKLCDYRRKNPYKGKKKCNICNGWNSKEHGHENVQVSTNKGGIIIEEDYDFVCYVCYKELSEESKPKKRTKLDDWTECSVCKLATDPLFGKFDGEIFTCNDCLDSQSFDEFMEKKETNNSIVLVGHSCSLCKHKIDKSEGAFYNPTYETYICAECVANYTEQCCSCDKLTPVDLGNYINGDFMCINCIIKPSQSK